MAVLSACQTAIADISELPDEVFSIATILLAAGSACSVASLWSVDDFATALLMTRFYEELFGETAPRPPEALGRAQLWLRRLDEKGERAYLAAHPDLERVFKARVHAGRTPGDRVGSRAGRATWPYSHPQFWAPFIAVGA